MIKLLMSIYDEGPAGVFFFMCISTLCLCLFLTAVSGTYVNIHKAVNQCHVQENNQ